MSVNLKENELLLRCCCYSKDHHVFLIHEVDDSRGNNLKGQDDDWYLSYLLDPLPFWKRLKRAIWPRSGRFGMYAELVLKNEDAEKIAQFILARLVGRELMNREEEK